MIEMMCKMIIQCHEYFKQNEESSSISLRDVDRFNTLYKWFKKSLDEKKGVDSENGVTNKYKENKLKYRVRPETILFTNDEIEIRANILALCHCYYLRISNLEQRKQFLDQVCNIGENCFDVTPQFIIEVLNNEQNDYLCRMELPYGTAVNQAIKENIFALIPCVM